MGLFNDDLRLHDLERADKYQSAKIFIQEVRLKALETGQPPDPVKVLKKMREGFGGDPYRLILLDYAIELLGSKPTDEIPEDGLP